MLAVIRFLLVLSVLNLIFLFGQIAFNVFGQMLPALGFG